MRALTGELLLAAWEAAAAAHDQRRPLALLSAALPDSDPAALAAMSIAERNLQLLRLHELSFGPRLDVFGVCPECGARLEFTVSAAELAGQLATRPGVPAEWIQDGYRCRLRPVTTNDLVASLGVPDPGAAAEFLLARCLEVCQDDDPERGFASPPPSPSAPAVARQFEEMHADTELRCAVECPECSARQVLDLDIARFVWREVWAAAARLLGEIHLLAAAYGWPERDIARLSPARRAAYLELVGA